MVLFKKCSLKGSMDFSLASLKKKIYSSSVNHVLSAIIMCSAIEIQVICEHLMMLGHYCGWYFVPENIDASHIKGPFKRLSCLSSLMPTLLSFGSLRKDSHPHLLPNTIFTHSHWLLWCRTVLSEEGGPWWRTVSMVTPGFMNGSWGIVVIGLPASCTGTTGRFRFSQDICSTLA